MCQYSRGIIFCLFVINAIPVAGGEIKLHEKITINILSRHIRLIKEGRKENITLDFPEDSEIIDNISGKRIRSGFLKLDYQKGKWIIEHEDGVLTGRVDLVCRSVNNRSTAAVNINGERRTYPLPIKIVFKTGKPVMLIKENIYRYAADSSLAEYGPLTRYEDESMKALISVILARSFHAGKHPYHSTADFCDLTHCQVYRGRLQFNLKKRYMMDHSIDIRNLRTGLLFHSSCGGETLDNRVFGSPDSGFPGIKDILYRDRTVLCKPENKSWEREITGDELAGILKIPNPGTGRLMLEYDKAGRIVRLSQGTRKTGYPPETFRLILNRKKGWNFIKSNNYFIDVRQVGGETRFSFSGKGLGHGVGICQHGSLELSRRGYSWYEILQHYYRGIKVVHNEGDSLSPGVSYGIFDISTGEFSRKSNPAFMNRKFPPGSLWKLIVSLYIAKERQDIFKDYTFRCTGKTDKNGPLPKRCWKPGGHGVLNFSRAISNSCNLYFASLYKRINIRDFKEFYRELCRSIGMANSMPDINNHKEAASLLAGLDFRLWFTISGLVKIAGILNPEFVIDENVRGFKQKIPLSLRMKIWNALQRTFTHGTGKFSLKNFSRDRSLSSFIYDAGNRDILGKNADGMWGKTSTVIDGTNLPLSYGIFLGGYNEKGIIVILRNGVGNMAAQWGKLLLLNRLKHKEHIYPASLK